MKVMKRLLAVALVLGLALSLSVTVFADEVTTGTVKNDTSRSYKAYQIFSGTQAENGVPLGGIEWGTGINKETFLAALKSDNADNAFIVEDANIFANCSTAKDVAEVLSKYTDKSSEAQAFAKLAYVHRTDVSTDVEASKSVTLNSGYYLMVDQSDVADKNEAKNPALLQVTNDSELNITEKAGVPKIDKTIEGEGEVAEGSIGDTFTFVLTATMPATFEGYDTYKVVFHDTLSKGLTYNNDASVDVDGFQTETSTDDNGNTIITITNNNVLTQNVTVNSEIVVTYTATLNSDAVIGSVGNPNVVYLEFSNDPNWDGTGTEPTGKTPKDTVVVFTFELDVTKVDGANANTKLSGAEFKLQNTADNKWAVVGTDGKLTGWVENKDNGTVLTSDANGMIKVIGLDQGTYNLEEIKAPAGYNKLSSPVVLVVTASVTDEEATQELTALAIKVGEENGTGDIATGIVGATVKNNAGATLPETGGMGTTLFYIVGGLLALAAVVLLVTKKRMSSES